MVGMLAACLLFAAATVAHAGVVEFVATSLGGSLWRYAYSVKPSVSFDELTIYFDPGNYELLGAPLAPTGWDPLVIQPDTGIPARGYFDALSLDGPVDSSVGTLSFSVEFSYLGTGSPASQAFEMIDSPSFRVIDSGTTSPAAVVPEPSSTALLSLGLVAMLAARANIRRAPRPRRETGC